MFKTTLTAAAFAASTLCGSVAYSANIDLGFIMDRSGSVGSAFPAAMNALGDALGAALAPTIGGPDTYTVAVITFSDTVTTEVARTVIDSQATLDAVVADIKTGNNSGSGLTNYKLALDTLGAAFASSGLGDVSLINMMTDGLPNEPGSNSNARAEAFASANALSNAGWDSLSFESVGNSTGNNLLQRLCFSPSDPNPVDDNSSLCPLFTDGSQINDPLTQPFVLDLPNFGAYNSVIGTKIQKIVDPDPVPVPAALPLLAGGLALFGFVGRRRRAAA